jgi:EF-hand domain-containing protein 1
LKRHLVPKTGRPTDLITWRDLCVATNIDIYSRIFRIIDCDEFTRSFYASEGIDLQPAESLPDDPFVHTRALVYYKQFPPDRGEVKNYIEVTLRGGRPNGNLKSFLDNDRQVLSFAIMWSDNTYDGGDKFFRLNFFLADDTVEVKEINKQNSGYYPFSKLLRRQKLSSTPILTHLPFMNLRKEQFYSPEDLKCGSTVIVWGRECLIYDADDFTKEWYRVNLNLQQHSVPLKIAAPDVLYQAIPAHIGYGTEEDAMGSVVSLNAKVPKYDMKKMFKQDMHTLRFNARLVSTEPDDESRLFLISYFCGNDTIHVYEVCDKNSGRIGGPFIQRQKIKNPETSDYYRETDFMIGRTVFLSGFKFMLVSTDEYTAKYMEDNGDVFPEADLQAIYSKIMAGSRKFASL